MRATGARLAGQALCFVGCSKAKPLSHQLSDAEFYVSLSTAEGDSLTICNPHDPDDTLAGLIGFGAENSVIEIHDVFSFLG